MPYEILKGYLKDKEFKRKKLYNDIYRLKKQGLIEKNFCNEGYLLKLTNKGRLQAEFINATSQPIFKQKKWRGNWYLVIFDIPNKKASIRHRISSILREIGCILIQKSVYLSPYPFRDRLLIIARYYHVESYFYYFEIPDQIVFDQFRECFFER